MKCVLNFEFAVTKVIRYLCMRICHPKMNYYTPPAHVYYVELKGPLFLVVTAFSTFKVTQDVLLATV